MFMHQSMTSSITILGKFVLANSSDIFHHKRSDIKRKHKFYAKLEMEVCSLNRLLTLRPPGEDEAKLRSCERHDEWEI